ncbi:hypothetical protein F4703DRAFT_1789749 [Phycomyces blakesleeanus]
MYKQTTRKMAPVNHRTSRPNAGSSLTQVAAGRVEQRPVTPAVTQEQHMAEMTNRLDGMGALLGSLGSRFVAAIAMSLASNNRQVLPVVTTSSAPSYIGMSEAETKTAILIHNRRQDIHTKYWKVIDKEMGLTIGENSEMAFFGAIQQTVMSDDEFYMEDLVHGVSAHILKFNKFMGLIDKSMRTDNAGNGAATPKMPKLQRGEKNVAVPGRLILSLPSWEIKQFFYTYTGAFLHLIDT